MCKFKKGDKVIIVKSQDGNLEVLRNGVTGVVLDLQVAPFVQFNIDANDCLHDACGIGEAGKCYSMDEDELELYSEYKQSNRYKLLQAIKETGYSSRRLSDIAVGNESYFYNYTGKARFDKKGDITEERLNYLLTTLAFAERELLGVGAKTVDDNPIIDKNSQSDTDNEIDEDLKESIDDSKINEQTKLYSEYFDSAKKRIQQKRDSKVRNFLIVFLIFIVILSIYFFTR